MPLTPMTTEKGQSVQSRGTKCGWGRHCYGAGGQ
ncbi:hypothetical protein E1A91_D11G062100v1 [Gossypium mustelinum]|uniref:Uncharacterized protein n=1 Tax=Gossypium mustelinum TaxID=34275 RepID=A0A5D2SNL7_GOSMU|nr:hypothetical protein E1A91_D11G062100v1 [Gossypium mustelinum]